ncbi:MAG: class I SAM-dependent methyltransferase [Phycisphaerales bacterium]|nr:class I SAM-dependent methyltransferase [Phycisphaerales bacterium]
MRCTKPLLLAILLLPAALASRPCLAQDRDRLKISPPPTQADDIRQPENVAVFDLRDLLTSSGGASLFPPNDTLSLSAPRQVEAAMDTVKSHGGFAAMSGGWLVVKGDPWIRTSTSGWLQDIASSRSRSIEIEVVVCELTREDPDARESSKGFLQPRELRQLSQRIADGSVRTLARGSARIGHDTPQAIPLEISPGAGDIVLRAEARTGPFTTTSVAVALERKPTDHGNQPGEDVLQKLDHVVRLKEDARDCGYVAHTFRLPDASADHPAPTDPPQRILDPGKVLIALFSMRQVDAPGGEAPNWMQPVEIYGSRPATRDGIGKTYFDREIAKVMGHLAAGWLERPEREQEEKTSRLVSMLPVEEDDVIADIGAGSGYFTRRLSPLVPGGSVIATDIQPEMLSYLRQGLEAEGITNVRTVLGTIDDTGIEPETVDLILLVDVYHEFDHPWEMSRSMLSALKPGGLVALVEYRANDPMVPIKPLHTMTEEQARLEFECAGFEWAWTLEGLPWQRLIVFRRPAPQDEEPTTDSR